MDAAGRTREYLVCCERCGKPPVARVVYGAPTPEDALRCLENQTVPGGDGAVQVCAGAEGMPDGRGGQERAPGAGGSTRAR